LVASFDELPATLNELLVTFVVTFVALLAMSATLLVMLVATPATPLVMLAEAYKKAGSSYQTS